MLPVRLEIRNFLAYRSPEPIYFDGIHLACITGPNGAGKSSLLDAITWVLWGKARARRDEDLVHLGQTDMHVQLDFEQEGTIYRVIRRRTRKSGGSGTLDLFVVDNGDLHTRSESSARATQQKINDLLRLDYETFVHSAFLQQGKADAFTTKAPAQRKQILSDILGLDRWEAYEETAKDRLKTISEKLATVEGAIRQIDDELAEEPRLRAELAEAQAAHDEARGALDEADTRLREVQHAPDYLRNAQRSKAALEQQIREREQAVTALDIRIQQRRERIAEYEMLLNARDEIEQGYTVLQTAREASETLSDKLALLREVERERNSLERALAAERAELENRISRCDSTIRELQRTMEAAQHDQLAALRAEVRELETCEGERDALDAEARAMETERAELKGGNDTLKLEMNEIKNKIDRLTRFNEAICPFCGQALDEAHRALVLADWQLEGTSRGNQYRANVARYDEMGERVVAIKRRVGDLSGEVKRLSSLKAQVAALKAGVDAADDARGRLAAEQAEIEALRTALDNEAYGEPIRVQLQALNEQQAALEYDEAAHTEARQQLAEYREYDERHKKLEQADAALPDLRAALDEAQAQRVATLEALEQHQAALEATQAEIGQLELLVQEFNKREGEVRLLQAQWRRALEAMTIAQQKLNALESQRKRREQLEIKQDEAKQQKAIYEELRVAFSKNGIPAMIIETAIPELETESNQLLTRMTDGRMNLAITTQREKVTGGVAETLDIQISDELGTRSYELYSGGEAFRINFAIRVALSQLLARRAGAHLRTLFLDEGFGTQDDDGRNKLVEAITAVQKDFDLILIITHIDELRDAFPVHIVLDKSSEGSRVSVR